MIVGQSSGGMRILFVHPNYRSGGAEFAGTWPPAWVAYLSGHLRQAGFDDIRFIDATTDNIADEDLGRMIAKARPDAIGVTAITPSICRAEPDPARRPACAAPPARRARRPDPCGRDRAQCLDLRGVGEVPGGRARHLRDRGDPPIAGERSTAPPCRFAPIRQGIATPPG